MAADDDTVRVDAEALRALAAGVAIDRSLEVFVGPSGCGWCIDTHTGRIQVDPDDLAHLPDEQLYGLICHEAAHAAMTRYPWLVPQSVLGEPGIRTLLNALEDCRIESWLMQRLPGATSWIEAYNARLFPTDPFATSLAPQAEQDARTPPSQQSHPPLFWQYCIGLLHEWWTGALPDSLDARVRRALERTTAARRAVVACLPPIHAEAPDPHQASRYVNSRVARVFHRLDGLNRPDPFEIAVRLAAAESWARIWSDILPVYRELVAMDPPGTASDTEQLLLERMGDVSGWADQVAVRPASRHPADMEADPAHVPASAESHPVPLHLPAIDERSRAAALHPEPSDAWEEARRDVLPLVDALVDELLDVLRPRSLPRWISGFSTGQRIELRSAMRAEARLEIGRHDRRRASGVRDACGARGRHTDPFRDLWARKTLPQRPDPRFLMLLDLSGSMRGAPIHWGFRGTVLLAEVLERLGLPTAIYGFQDTLIPFKPFETPLDHARPSLSTMPLEVHGTRPGGHNQPEHNWDGPVLLQAADILSEQPCRTPLLIVVSDGEPSGPSDAASALREAVTTIAGSVDVIGLGLGPGTRHVRKYYPNAVADVPLDAFPAAIGACIRAALLSEPGRPPHPPPSHPASSEPP